MYRVSEDEGRENLNITRENGWVFIGRCTFEIAGRAEVCWTRLESGALPELTAVERGRIASLSGSDSVWNRNAVGLDGLLANLGRALQYFCTRGLRYIAPTNNALLYAMPPSDAVSGVLRREIGLQCQGFRSVFIWLAISCGWLDVENIREVDAFRYSAVPGIDVNSHALLEIRDPDGRWFAMDPLSRVVFTDGTGALLSAEQLAALRRSGRLDTIRVAYLVERCVSDSALDSLEAIGTYGREPDFADRDPLNPNYWGNFALLTLRVLSLVPEGPAAGALVAD